jgi:fucose 4-O-acetylase-like acetyltransferase
MRGTPRQEGSAEPVSATLIPAAPLAAAPPQRAARRTDIDRVKGLAILLVVFGHLVARQAPADVRWYEPLRIAVYLFHMPLFMYLSGYVTFLSGAARMPLIRWPQLVRRRAARLLLPFLLFGLAVLFGKMVAARFFAVDNVPPDYLAGLRDLVWDTAHSPATSVWYIAVLFVFCVATPPLLALDRSRILIVAVAALLYVLPLPPPLYLDRVGTYFLFFVAGGLAADAGPRWQRCVDATWLAALALLAAVILPVSLGWIQFEWIEGAQGFPYKWALLIAGLLALPAMHGLVRHAGLAQSATLLTLGRYVFVIYLLNTLFIGATKAVLLKFVSWDGAHFLPFAAALMLAGTLGPILTKCWLLRRIPALDRATE